MFKMPRKRYSKLTLAGAEECTDMTLFGGHGQIE
jgi:hypothetical protein